jgi:hypothetical protein
MRTLKFDNYTIKAKTIETASNYDLSVQIFRNGEKMPVGGTIMKRGSSDRDILQFAFHNIEKPVDFF